MPTVKCEECAGEVSSSAGTCPYCGAPVVASPEPVTSPPHDQALPPGSDGATVKPRASSAQNEKEWYYATDDDEQHGPVGRTELENLLSRRVLRPEVLVWTDRLDEWTPARDVAELHWKRTKVPPPLSRPSKGSPPTPMPPPQPVAPQGPPGPPPYYLPQSTPYPYPAFMGDDVTLRHKGTIHQVHADQSSRGRLINVIGKVLTYLSIPLLALGLYFILVKQETAGGLMVIVLGAIPLLTGMALRAFGSVYEHIYRRDGTDPRRT